MSNFLTNQNVVIDNGTGVMKAGFAGGDKPKVVFRSYIGRTKHTRIMPGGALEGSEIFVGNKADEHRGAMVLNYPMEHGIVQNWSGNGAKMVAKREKMRSTTKVTKCCRKVFQNIPLRHPKIEFSLETCCKNQEIQWR